MLPFRGLIESIPNFVLLILVLITSIIGVVSWFIYIDSEIVYITDNIFGYSALIIIVKNGKFHKSKFFRYFLLCISLVLLSVALAVTRTTEYGKLALTLSTSLVIVVYFIYFLNKKTKSLLDYSKLIFLSSLIAIKLIRYNHWLYLTEISLVFSVSAIVTVFLLYFKHRQEPNWITD